MKRSQANNKIDPWLVVILIALIVYLGIASYSGLLGQLLFKPGPFYFHHWMTLIGSGYIIIFIPIFHVLRLRNPGRYGTLIRFHIYGNLMSIGLITIHFSHQLKVLPDLGTGLTLYLTIFFLITTGILLRFGFVRRRRAWWHYLHTGINTAFYLLIIFHTLKGLGVF